MVLSVYLQLAGLHGFIVISSCIFLAMKQFLLDTDKAYQQWREQKLANYPRDTEKLFVDIDNPYKLTAHERNALLSVCQKTNIVIYKIKHADVGDKKIVAAIANQLGLWRMDANLCADQDKISSIQVMNEGLSGFYIPYTNKPLNWHTDGYYNQDEQRIRAFLMHCVQPAKSGGENTYMDPEIIYILLRDDDPNLIEALMDKNAMCIPANGDEKQELRNEASGPVFMVDEPTQTLYMRYTARPRNVAWKNNHTTNRARAKLLDIMQDGSYQFNHRLQTGEGVICNNVLHNRTMFSDDSTPKRLIFRARFYDRISNSIHTS